LWQGSRTTLVAIASPFTSRDIVSFLDREQ
jgi:hypothetical protein